MYMSNRKIGAIDSNLKQLRQYIDEVTNIATVIDTPKPLTLRQEVSKEFNFNEAALAVLGENYNVTSTSKGNRFVSDEYYTSNKIATLSPNANSVELAVVFNNLVDDFAIDIYSLDMLLAQLYVESSLIHNRVEKLSYSKSRMLQVYGKHHNDIRRNPSRYVHNSRALANYVYASRLGNGPVSSGDGYRYRGRGLIQLTGKANYKLMTKLYNRKFVNSPAIDLVNDPNMALNIIVSPRIALLYCDNRNIFDKITTMYTRNYDDTAIIVAVTKIINGGRNGLSDRIRAFRRVNKITNTYLA